MTQRGRQIISLVLLAAGTGIGFAAYAAGDVSFRFWPIAAATVAGLIALSWLYDLLEFLNLHLPRHRLACAMASALFGALSCLDYVHGRGHQLCPRMHDDHVFMIQAQMMARGRLYLPAYPPDISPFFDSFHLFSQPVYAGMYCPGTALMLAPEIWLHAPFWTMPIVVAALAAALLFASLEELFGIGKALAGVLMMCLGYWYRDLTTTALSEMPMFVSLLALFWSWLRWRKTGAIGWAAMMGAAAAFGAITRPFDGLCFAALFLSAIVFEFRRQPRALLRATAIACLAGLPFAALQIRQNIDLSGKWFTLGETALLRHIYPAPPVGFFKLDFSRLPSHPPPEKAAWLNRFVIPAYESHTVHNAVHWFFSHLIQYVQMVTLPHWLLFALATAGILSVSDIRRAVPLVCLVIFLPAYTCVVFFLVHYLFPMTLPMIALVLMGWYTLENAWPRHRRQIGAFLAAFILTLSIADLPLCNPEVRPDAIDFHDREQRMANAALEHLPLTPAVVLFRFDPSACDPHDEPVYNDGVPWPDDASVIRAHDLGPAADEKLVQYYRQRQPDRLFYFYDRGAALRGENPLSTAMQSTPESRPLPPR